jgi:hypothetical protein
LSIRNADWSYRLHPRQLRHIKGARRHIETKGGKSPRLAEVGSGNTTTVDRTARRRT